MKRTVKGTAKLFTWLALIVAFASYSVTPAFARMPPRNSNSTTPKNSRLRDHTTRTKILLLTELHSAEPLHNHLEDLQIIDFKTLSSEAKFNKRSLSAEEMKALKNALTKAAAAKGCTMLEGDSWWSCMKTCLGDVGVSAYSLIICGATCITLAVPICAICLGVTVAVVEACGVGCVIYAN